jgi:formylglycine-generating enzyme required for sulfatase activity
MTPSPSPGAVLRDAPWCPELVVIPPGAFMMGSTEAERRWAVDHDARWEWVENEQPRHRVEIAYPLAVGRFLVTFEQYDRFARITRRAEPGDDGWGRGQRPVIKVSWEDAKAYVDWLAAETGQPYRLLSEAEWEYACRAGTMTRYWWGDEITSENANYGKNIGKTREVGSYPANPWGLHDTHGTVWEWVEDCWNDRYDRAPADGRAWTSGDCSHRVMRGGSWKNRIWDLRSAKRFKMRAAEWVNDFGFRVARTLTP